jgi:hypothetical protein
MRALAIFAAMVLVPATALADDESGVKTVIRDHVDVTPKVIETTPPPPPPPPPVVVVKPPPPPPPPKPVAGGYVEPSFVPYEGGKLPADAKLTTEPNMALVGAGLTVLGLSYVPSIIAAAAVCPPQAACSATPGAGWLYLPFVGPFVTAAMATSPGGAALAAFDGAVQLTGAALAVAGLVVQKKLVMWQDKNAKLTVTPGAGNGAGVSLTLTHL